MECPFKEEKKNRGDGRNDRFEYRGGVWDNQSLLPTLTPLGTSAMLPLHLPTAVTRRVVSIDAGPAVKNGRRFMVGLNALGVIAGSNRAVVCRDVLYSLRMSAPDL